MYLSILYQFHFDTWPGTYVHEYKCNLKNRGIAQHFCPKKHAPFFLCLGDAGKKIFTHHCTDGGSGCDTGASGLVLRKTNCTINGWEACERSCPCGLFALSLKLHNYKTWAESKKLQWVSYGPMLPVIFVLLQTSLAKMLVVSQSAAHLMAQQGLSKDSICSKAWSLLT